MIIFFSCDRVQFGEGEKEGSEAFADSAGDRTRVRAFDDRAIVRSATGDGSVCVRVGRSKSKGRAPSESERQPSSSSPHRRAPRPPRSARRRSAAIFVSSRSAAAFGRSHGSQTDQQGERGASIERHRVSPADPPRSPRSARPRVYVTAPLCPPCVDPVGEVVAPVERRSWSGEVSLRPSLIR